MQIGFVGLQNSGKTILFDTLSHREVEQEKKGEINKSVVKIPDERLDKLTEIFIPKKKVNATLEIVDIQGLPLSNDGKVKITTDFLNKVKNNDALMYVIRQFQNTTIPNPYDTIDPLRDILFLETEFLLADMTLIENRLEKIKKDILKSKSEQLQSELPLFTKLSEHISQEIPLRELSLDHNEMKLLSGYQFLTIKPLIVAINFDEESKENVNEIINKIEQAFPNYKLNIIPFFGKFEYELSKLSDEEAKIFMEDFGITESALTRILKTSYELLGLQSFFTVGEDECRAWTIKKNSNAQESAGVIHTDFYNKFIRAEVVHYDDFIKYGSFHQCKEVGVWRLEGKEYIVKDGDILNIRHS